jgi:hypothetical protein
MVDINSLAESMRPHIKRDFDLAAKLIDQLGRLFHEQLGLDKKFTPMEVSSKGEDQAEQYDAQQGPTTQHE